MYRRINLCLLSVSPLESVQLTVSFHLDFKTQGAPVKFQFMCTQQHSRYSSPVAYLQLYLVGRSAIVWSLGKERTSLKRQDLKALEM